MFKLYLFTDTVISLYRGRFYAWCAKNSSLYREYRYIEDRYIRVLSHTFYCNFCWDIVFLLLYRGYRYIEDSCIGVPLYIMLSCIRYSFNMLQADLLGVLCKQITNNLVSCFDEQMLDGMHYQLKVCIA